MLCNKQGMHAQFAIRHDEDGANKPNLCGRANLAVDERIWLVITGNNFLAQARFPVKDRESNIYPYWQR